jgi:hypothetical protein
MLLCNCPSACRLQPRSVHGHLPTNCHPHCCTLLRVLPCHLVSFVPQRLEGFKCVRCAALPLPCPQVSALRCAQPPTSQQSPASPHNLWVLPCHLVSFVITSVCGVLILRFPCCLQVSAQRPLQPPISQLSPVSLHASPAQNQASGKSRQHSRAAALPLLSGLLCPLLLLPSLWLHRCLCQLATTQRWQQTTQQQCLIQVRCHRSSSAVLFVLSCMLSRQNCAHLPW